MAGTWQQHQVYDGTYSIDDLLDWHEMNMVKIENQDRWRKYQESVQEK